MEQALRFKAMYSRLGFSVADAAQFLQVSTRTVHQWISGRVRIPFAAYKLLRVQLHYELPGDAWNGWHLSAGRLYTPEGHELRPQDFVWWGLLVRQARSFNTLYEANTALRAAAGPDGDRAAACRDRGSDRPGGRDVLVTRHFRVTDGQGNQRPARREVLVTLPFSPEKRIEKQACRWCGSKQRRGSRADQGVKWPR